MLSFKYIILQLTIFIYNISKVDDKYTLKLTLDHCTEGHLIAEEISESGFPAREGLGVEEGLKAIKNK